MHPYETLLPSVVCPPVLQSMSNQAVMFRPSQQTATEHSASARRSTVTNVRFTPSVVPVKPSGSYPVGASIGRASSLLQSYDNSLLSSASSRRHSHSETSRAMTAPSGAAATTSDGLQPIGEVEEASSVLPEPVDSLLSAFLGSRRMETMLQALGNERNSGLYIRSFIDNTDDKVCCGLFD